MPFLLYFNFKHFYKWMLSFRVLLQLNLTINFTKLKKLPSVEPPQTPSNQNPAPSCRFSGICNRLRHCQPASSSALPSTTPPSARSVPTYPLTFHLPYLVNSTFYFVAPSQEFVLHSFTLTDPHSETTPSLPPTRTSTFTKKWTSPFFFSNFKPFSLIRASSSYALFHFLRIWHMKSNLPLSPDKKNTS